MSTTIPARSRALQWLDDLRFWLGLRAVGVTA